MTISIRRDRLRWAIAGVLGCLLAIWNLGQVYCWLDYLGYMTSKKNVFIVLLGCVGCICVFIYSLFDGKGEKYLRLIAWIILAVMFFAVSSSKSEPR